MSVRTCGWCGILTAAAVSASCFSNSTGTTSGGSASGSASSGSTGQAGGSGSQSASAAGTAGKSGGTGTSGAQDAGAMSGSAAKTGTSGGLTSTGGSGSGSPGSAGGAIATMCHDYCRNGPTASAAPAGVAGAPNGPYTVSGPQILDQDGKPHLFRGADIPSLEWNCFSMVQELDYTTLAMWGANAVRVPLNQDCWLSGSASEPNKTYNPLYESAVDDRVCFSYCHGMDVILDLHWSDQGSFATGDQCYQAAMTDPSHNCQQIMADQHSVTFWQQAAARYANFPNVLFELYNEPHASSWSAVLNDTPPYVGMQTLYNTVRGAGANNLVIVGGTQYAYDLRGVLAQPVNGTGIIYNTHPYPSMTPATPSGWETYFGYLTSTYPVIATEFGNNSGTQPANCDSSFDSNLVPFMDAKSTAGTNPMNPMSWTAWAFFNAGCSFPALLADSNYTPNAPGAVVKAALLAGP